MDREIDKVIDIVGNQAALARVLGLSNNAVCKWVSQGFIPAGRVIEVMSIVEGKTTSTGDTVHLENLLLQSFANRHSPIKQPQFKKKTAGNGQRTHSP